MVHISYFLAIIKAFKIMNQMLLNLCGLACVCSLRISHAELPGIPQQPQLEKHFQGFDEGKMLMGTGFNGQSVQARPGALKPGEQLSDFVHTLGGVKPPLRNGTGQLHKVKQGYESEKPTTAILLVGLMRGWQQLIDNMMDRMIRPNDAHVFIHSHPLHSGIFGNKLARV
eukprot:gnl/MRDRNA2_/MRDRNA2_86138_c0_seq2.p1 gnl/MRDRNA2_/MRDRNA2_86138_c0~~gnl/MRDRNA2_/MRDRNA2_86138_c0_seq2.p1  ORF type:complete len:170 (+),score=23.12 gnl/MRDRNA2_/MRDRNA2_86138_c0_seq2:94-603(+)